MLNYDPDAKPKRRHGRLPSPEQQERTRKRLAMQTELLARLQAWTRETRDSAGIAALAAEYDRAFGTESFKGEVV